MPCKSIIDSVLFYSGLLRVLVNIKKPGRARRLSTSVICAWQTSLSLRPARFLSILSFSRSLCQESRKVANFHIFCQLCSGQAFWKGIGITSENGELGFSLRVSLVEKTPFLVFFSSLKMPQRWQRGAPAGVHLTHMLNFVKLAWFGPNQNFVPCWDGKKLDFPKYRQQ